MTTTKQLLSAFALTLLFVSGVANAVPHPQPGHANPIDFRSVVPGLDDRLDEGIVVRAKAAPAGNVQSVD